MLCNSLKRFFILQFTLVLFVLQLHAQTNVGIKNYEPSVYAGIEVGSKGVKLSIIEMGKNATSNGSFKSVKDTSINSDFISFTPASFTATVDGLTALYNMAVNTYNIPTNKIYTVVSSGVKGQAAKENNLAAITKLSDSFRAKINEPNRVVDVIDIKDEAILSHIGIVPESRRYNTFLIDIGSGNTKGGYFRNGNTNEMKLFTLNWGTKTVANATEKRLEDDKSIPNYKKQLMRVLAGEPNNEIIYAVNESDAYNMNDYFAFSGGIAWSVATLMYPELIDNSVVPVTYNDLVKFNETLTTNFNSLSAENLLKNTSTKNLMRIAEVERVHKVFDQKSLMAGAALLQNIIRQFEGTMEKKQFFLVKNGQVGWISAYVNKSVHP